MPARLSLVESLRADIARSDILEVPNWPDEVLVGMFRQGLDPPRPATAAPRRSDCVVLIPGDGRVARVVRISLPGVANVSPRVDRESG